MKYSIIILSAIIAFGCASKKFLTPTQTDVDRMSAQIDGLSLADLTEGKALYDAHCGSCHPKKAPSSKTEKEWRKIVPYMSNKVNKKKGLVIGEDEQEKILRYVLTMREADVR